MAKHSADPDFPMYADEPQDEDAPAKKKPKAKKASAGDGTPVAGSSDPVLLTADGLAKLREELNYLTKVRRKEVADKLKEAISYGDLSENAEYDQAKYDQAFVEGRIAELELKIKHAQVIEEESGGTTVQIGSTVTLKNLTENEEETYTIVGSTEADPLKGKISNESPVGHAVLSQKEDKEVTVNVPAGVVKYRILKIS